MFPTHWRWNSTIALAVRRFRNGKKQPPQFQRSDAEDLMAVVFPDQLACAENITTGYREIPDHPLVEQTVDDCLNDLMDIEGLKRLLDRIKSGEVEVICRDLAAPSPLAQEIINARPYAFLDDAPAEERRTQAVRSRHLLDPEDAADIGRLNPAAIETVREEASDWQHWLTELVAAKRATLIATGTRKLWVAAERLGQLQQVFPTASLTHAIEALELRNETEADADVALVEILRSRLEGLGPVPAAQLANELDLDPGAIEQALGALELEGFAMRGRYTADAPVDEWCDRRLLARINRYTVKQLRREIDPVSPAVYMRFLFEWHGMGAERGRGQDALLRSLSQLEGFAAPAGAWEASLLPARVLDYLGQDLDQLMQSGQISWLRAGAPQDSAAAPVATTPIALVSRNAIPLWRKDAPSIDGAGSGKAQRLVEVLERSGASFFADLVDQSGLMRAEAEQSLAELVALGKVTSDSFRGLRELLKPVARKRAQDRQRRRSRRQFSAPTMSVSAAGLDGAGRWSLIKPVTKGIDLSPEQHEQQLMNIASTLLRRYGVVYRAVLTRELKHLPPWRDLVRVYRRMEAAGDIRGGRFVTGFSGEQFASADAVGELRRIRRLPEDNHSVCVSACDPLNLAGIVTPGEKIAAQKNNRVLYRNGIPVAFMARNEFQWLAKADANAEWTARNLLLRDSQGASFLQRPPSYS
jgi:ATP-dependent Lhr-like helicase